MHTKLIATIGDLQNSCPLINRICVSLQANVFLTPIFSMASVKNTSHMLSLLQSPVFMADTALL